MDTKEAIRQNLLRLMGESGTKNVELARAVGVSKAAVTNWLNGNNSIDVNLVPKICEFFGVSIDEFLDVGTKKALSPEERVQRARPAHVRAMLPGRGIVARGAAQNRPCGCAHAVLLGDGDRAAPAEPAKVVGCPQGRAGGRRLHAPPDTALQPLEDGALLQFSIRFEGLGGLVEP